VGRMTTQLSLFADGEIPVETGRGQNPMVRLLGPGPEGKTCGECKYLVGIRYARTYWKCSLRGDLTHGPATDQRKGWRACALFEGRENAADE